MKKHVKKKMEYILSAKIIYSINNQSIVLRIYLLNWLLNVNFEMSNITQT